VRVHALAAPELSGRMGWAELEPTYPSRVSCRGPLVRIRHTCGKRGRQGSPHVRGNQSNKEVLGGSCGGVLDPQHLPPNHRPDRPTLDACGHGRPDQRPAGTPSNASERRGMVHQWWAPPEDSALCSADRWGHCEIDQTHQGERTELRATPWAPSGSRA